MVPRLAAPGPVAQLIQIGCDPLCPIALLHIFFKDNPHHSGLVLVECQFVKLMLFLVEPSSLYKIVPIWSNTALKVSVLDKLAEGGFCADGGLFTYYPSVRGILQGCL